MQCQSFFSVAQCSATSSLGACILPSNSPPLLFHRGECEGKAEGGGVELFSRDLISMVYVRDGTRSKYVTRGSSED